jgi:hypothetical protein
MVACLGAAGTRLDPRTAPGTRTQYDGDASAWLPQRSKDRRAGGHVRPRTRSSGARSTRAACSRRGHAGAGRHPDPPMPEAGTVFVVDDPTARLLDRAVRGPVVPSALRSATRGPGSTPRASRTGPTSCSTATGRSRCDRAAWCGADATAARGRSPGAARHHTPPRAVHCTPMTPLATSAFETERYARLAGPTDATDADTARCGPAVTFTAAGALPQGRARACRRASRRTRELPLSRTASAVYHH